MTVVCERLGPTLLAKRAAEDNEASTGLQSLKKMRILEPVQPAQSAAAVSPVRNNGAKASSNEELESLDAHWQIGLPAQCLAIELVPAHLLSNAGSISSRSSSNWCRRHCSFMIHPHNCCLDHQLLATAFPLT